MSWFVTVISCWKATYVRPRLSRASEGRCWFAGSAHTTTFGANGRSVGSGPGPSAGAAIAGEDPRAVRVREPLWCSRYCGGICAPVNAGGRAPVGAGAPGAPADAGAAADRMRTAANATTASTKTIAIPPNPSLDEDIEPPPGRTGTRFLPQSSDCASLLPYLSAFQLRGSVVEECGEPHPARCPHPRGVRSEEVHRAETDPLWARDPRDAPGAAPSGRRRPPPGGGPRALPAGPPRSGGPRPRGRRQLLAAGSRAAGLPPSDAGAAVPARR